MSYLLDKKARRKKYLSIFLLLVFLFVLFIFRVGIYRGISFAVTSIFRPILIVGNKTGDAWGSFLSVFHSKSSLLKENESLQIDIDSMEARMANYSALLDENLKLREILGRKEENKNLVLAAILSKPNQSPYDTLIIDVGEEEKIEVGEEVLALGSIPIGYIAEVYPKYSKVILFSNPGEKTEVVIPGRDVFMQLVGRGGGNFEMILFRDFVLPVGTGVVLRGINPKVFAIVETIITDPRESFQKALLVSPVNVQELKFVEIEK